MRSWLHMWQIKGKTKKNLTHAVRGGGVLVWVHLKRFHPGGSLPGWQCLHLDTRAHSGLRVKIKLLIGCGFHNQHISSQMNAYGRFWTSVLDRALNSLAIRLPESMPRCIKAVGFSFNCHPSVGSRTQKSQLDSSEKKKPNLLFSTLSRFRNVSVTAELQSNKTVQSVSHDSSLIMKHPMKIQNYKSRVHKKKIKHLFCDS